MKYITTEKHPFLKTGVICENIYSSFAIDKGWIKEIEEQKEFTPSQMIEFSNFTHNSGRMVDMEILDIWKKEKGIK